MEVTLPKISSFVFLSSLALYHSHTSNCSLFYKFSFIYLLTFGFSQIILTPIISQSIIQSISKCLYQVSASTRGITGQDPLYPRSTTPMLMVCFGLLGSSAVNTPLSHVSPTHCRCPINNYCINIQILMTDNDSRNMYYC